VIDRLSSPGLSQKCLLAPLREQPSMATSRSSSPGKHCWVPRSSVTTPARDSQGIRRPCSRSLTHAAGHPHRHRHGCVGGSWRRIVDLVLYFFPPSPRFPTFSC
jgi:hypothetical protein